MSKTLWDDSGAIKISEFDNIADGILSKRGYKNEQKIAFINPDYESGLRDPFLLSGMKKATKRIKSAIDNKEKIVIYGDYDIDGLSSSALLGDAFSMMGVEVDLYIPDRFEEGYGLNTKAIEKLKKDGFDLVITVDCGTTAHEQIARTKEIGLDIIVTDHHEPDGAAPKGAIACINPKLDSNSPLRDLAGVGVAFYLVRALQKDLGLIEPGQEKWLLDLVALGTICDVVPLTEDNRVLASFGLKVLQKTRRKGIIVLAQSCGMDISTANETDLGFKIGPRLNAAGRLAHAKKALDLLTTKDDSEAEDYSRVLNELNSKRQEDTRSIYEDANKMARKYKADPILVLASPDWSHGVVGIVASRIAEKWHKPVILLQQLEGASSKGSARSFGTFSIIEAIRACEEVLETFGGHDFAAGVKLKTERLDEFRYRINEYAIKNMDVKNNFKTIKLGVSLGEQGASLAMYEDLRRLAPFGNSNEKPYFEATYEISEIRLVGSDASHLRLQLKDADGGNHVAIGFGMANEYEWLELGKKARIAFELDENIWQDRRSHQLMIVDMLPVE